MRAEMGPPKIIFPPPPPPSTHTPFSGMTRHRPSPPPPAPPRPVRAAHLDDLFAEERAPAALDQVEVWVHLR
jgi:hypothetical protein